ncbi:hypothetical protein CPB86DRAFT_781753 [Serendipita vermifera]|nr:hypothetical protein CPB86DRAFT_781753 [Serendipita vermifera]
MAPIFQRSTRSESSGQLNIQGGVIAICVLCVVAGMCAIGVCAHYIWRSHKKDRERALSAKILLDRAMQRSVSMVEPANDKPPPYDYHNDPRRSRIG